MSMGANLDPKVLIGRIYVGGPLNIATYKIYKLWASWFQRRFLRFCFSTVKSLGANDPWGVANLDPRGIVGGIYVGDHDIAIF